MDLQPLEDHTFAADGCPAAQPLADGGCVRGRRAQRPRGSELMLDEEAFEGSSAPPVGPPGRVCAVEAQHVERHEMGEPLAGQVLRARTAPLQPTLKTLEGQPPGFPHHQFAVECGGVRELDGAGADLGEGGRQVGTPARAQHQPSRVQRESIARHPSHLIYALLGCS